ncbi:translocase of outer mitochondrial membrane [Tilletia horrida]|uniref:Translocase of outer mitochondrial membrane n=1 Tax=Tilletia horrida TaxID=155126 RepID=A0AAN6GSL2_9BASI|nr:translocase of outer mitochondrial membrane [Tilletia horrida]
MASTSSSSVPPATPYGHPASGAIPLGAGAPSPFLPESSSLPSTSELKGRRSEDVDGPLSALTYPFRRVYDSFSRHRVALDLPYPGLPERISHEANATFTTNHMFDGVRFDLAKGASTNPMFHISHNFHIGASQQPQGSYSFSTMYGTDQIFATANVDDSGAVSGRLNRRWSPAHTSKVQAQLVKGFGQTMFQVEHVLNGRDNSVSIKSINANPADGTGMFFFSYLQSVTKSLAVGIESLYARQPGAPEDLTNTFLLKWTGNTGRLLKSPALPPPPPGSLAPLPQTGSDPFEALDAPAPPGALVVKPDWVASANLVTQGVLQATYWQRLSDKVEAAAEVTVITTPAKREAEAKIGAKWDFRLASLRAQLDNFGRLTSVYEARLFPTFSLTFAAELDHLRSTGKFGFGVSIETPLAPEDPTLPPPPMPSPPFV